MTLLLSVLFLFFPPYQFKTVISYYSIRRIRVRTDRDGLHRYHHTSALQRPTLGSPPRPSMPWNQQNPMFGWPRGHLNTPHVSMASMLDTIMPAGMGPVASMPPSLGADSTQSGELVPVPGVVHRSPLNSFTWGSMTPLAHDGISTHVTNFDSRISLCRSSTSCTASNGSSC